MNVLLFGATGTIGSHIATEALNRGHNVTGVTRRGKGQGSPDPRLKVVAGDVTSAGDVARLAQGQDAVASAVRAPADNPKMLVAAARALVDGLRQAGVKRLVIVGGAGSLEVTPGVQLVDTPDFPTAWRPESSAHRDALAFYRGVEDLDWSYLSPAALIQPGERTGRFRIGADQLLTDEHGQSRISMEDFAIAFVDELERGKAIRRRITVSY